MPILSEMDVVITSSHEDNFSGLAEKALEQYRKFAVNAFRQIGDAGTQAFKRIQEAQENLKKVPNHPSGTRDTLKFWGDLGGTVSGVVALLTWFGVKGSTVIDFLKSLKDNFKFLNPVVKNLKFLLGPIISSFKSLTGLLPKIGAAFSRATPHLTAFAAGWAIGTKINEIEINGKPIKDYITDLVMFFESGQFTDKLKEIGATFLDWIKSALEPFAGIFKDVSDWARGFLNLIKEILAKAEKLPLIGRFFGPDKVSFQVPETDGLRFASASFPGPGLGFQNEIDGFRGVAAGPIILVDRAVGKVRDGLQGVNEELGGLQGASKEAFERMTQAAFQFSSQGKSALIDLITTGESRFKSFGDFVNSIFRNIINNFAQTAVSNLAQAAGSFLLNIFNPTAAAGTPEAAASSPAPRAPVSVGSNVLIPAAFGGPVRAGVPHLVGELGPEIFVPNASGQIIPNNQLAPKRGTPLAGGGTPKFEVNITNNTGAPVQQTQTRGPFGGRKINIVIGEMVANDIRAGGPVGRALRDTYGFRRNTIGR